METNREVSFFSLMIITIFAAGLFNGGEVEGGRGIPMTKNTDSTTTTTAKDAYHPEGLLHSVGAGFGGSGEAGKGLSESFPPPISESSTIQANEFSSGIGAEWFFGGGNGIGGYGSEGGISGVGAGYGNEGGISGGGAGYGGVGGIPGIGGSYGGVGSIGSADEGGIGSFGGFSFGGSRGFDIGQEGGFGGGYNMGGQVGEAGGGGSSQGVDGIGGSLSGSGKGPVSP